MQIFKKLFFLLNPRERKYAGLLMVLILIMAFIDIIGIASILPFMIVLTDPSFIEKNLILNSIFNASSIFGIKNNDQFIFILGILMFVLLVISLVFKAFTTYAQVRFVEMLQQSISKRLVEGYLYQPYSAGYKIGCR